MLKYLITTAISVILIFSNVVFAAAPTMEDIYGDYEGATSGSNTLFDYVFGYSFIALIVGIIITAIVKDMIRERKRLKCQTKK